MAESEMTDIYISGHIYYETYFSIYLLIANKVVNIGKSFLVASTGIASHHSNQDQLISCFHPLSTKRKNKLELAFDNVKPKD